MKAEAGPTLNPYYNQLLLDWAIAGDPSNPECEECGCDLTGKKVHDCGIMWCCDNCASENSDSDPDSDYRDAERKQMGIE